MNLGKEHDNSPPCSILGRIPVQLYTSRGRKFALVEGLSHNLVCAGSIYHVHFAWQVWHGQYSPGFKFNKLKSFSRGKIDQNHVDKRILGGKGFAVRRLKKHNFCPASVCMIFGGEGWVSIQNPLPRVCRMTYRRSLKRPTIFGIQSKMVMLSIPRIYFGNQSKHC